MQNATVQSHKQLAWQARLWVARCNHSMLFVTVVASRGKYFVKLGIGLGFDLGQGWQLGQQNQWANVLPGSLSLICAHMNSQQQPPSHFITNDYTIELLLY